MAVSSPCRGCSYDAWTAPSIYVLHIPRQSPNQFRISIFYLVISSSSPISLMLGTHAHIHPYTLTKLLVDDQTANRDQI